MSVKKQDWMQAWVSLIHAATHLKNGLEERLLDDLEITLAEQDLLKQLAVNDTALTLTEISRRLYFSKGGLTRMLDRLENAGLVRREAVAGDRRRSRAALTRKGRAVFERSRTIIVGYVQGALKDRLPDADLIMLKAILQRLLEAHDVFEGQQRHLRGEPGDPS